MDKSYELPEKPLWEKHTANGLYTIDKVLETPSDSEENAIEMFMVNRTSVRAKDKTHEVRYYSSLEAAEVAATGQDQTGEWPTEGEIRVE